MKITNQYVQMNAIVIKALKSPFFITKSAERKCTESLFY
jgi:hypothetical protein